MSTWLPYHVARITPLGEVLKPARLTTGVVRLVVQVFLMVALWRGLYANSGADGTAGIDRTQAVSYAVLAVLMGPLRWLSRGAGQDELLDHVESGTILYWFLRPMSPARYHVVRHVGDQIYGLAWFVVGYIACALVGVLRRPASPAAAAVTVVALVLGQVIHYQLRLLSDLAVFWMMRNEAAQLIISLLRDLFSGVFAPLWFFPGWFRAVSTVLPFQLTLNAPLSIHIGRIPITQVTAVLVQQAVWMVGLTALTRWVWRRVPNRLSLQGG